jgi:ubiquitin
MDCRARASTNIYSKQYQSKQQGKEMRMCDNSKSKQLITAKQAVSISTK